MAIMVTQISVSPAALTWMFAEWAGVASYVLLKITDALVGLRVNEEDESTGLDRALHEERGYNL